MDIKKNEVISKSDTYKITVRANIIQDINNHLYFGAVVVSGKDNGYRLTILNKETLQFREMVLHDPKVEFQTSAIIEGSCYKIN